MNPRSIPAALFLLTAALPAAETAKPNIVLILADDLGYGDLGCYGATKLATPNIDRLAREGTRFTRAYAPSSVCSPTRYAVMTGRYDWRTSVKMSVIGENHPLHIETDRLTLASLLQKHGYRTGAIGKWHLGIGTTNPTDWNNEPLKPGPLEVGFDYFFGLPANHENKPDIYLENHIVANRAPGEKITTTGRLMHDTTSGVKPPRDNEQCGPLLADKAISFLNTCPPDQPFFLYYCPIEPHVPITPHPDHKNTSDCGPYGDFVQQLDANVGRIIKELERKGVMENTLILFTSDNGGLAVPAGTKSEQGEALQRGHAINGLLRGRKHSIYEGGISVPFIARWPGRVPAGAVSGQPFGLVDILASTASLIGTTLPESAGEDSFDMLPLWLGKKPAPRAPLICASVMGGHTVVDGKWKWIEGGTPPGYAILGKALGSGFDAELKPQLYDLEKDPSESTDVKDQHPEIVAKLNAALNAARNNPRTATATP